MNPTPLRQANVAAAAVVIGGLLVLVAPRYALTIVQLVVVTIAISAGLHALAANVPPTGWISPFKWMAPFNQALRDGATGPVPDELRAIRSHFGGWRRPFEPGPALPDSTVRLLRPLIRAGLDLDLGERRRDQARGRVSARSWALLDADPADRPRWYLPVPPDARTVARAVHEVLDDLDRLHGRTGPTPSSSSVPHTLEP